jgi:hypothetical protein
MTANDSARNFVKAATPWSLPTDGDPPSAGRRARYRGFRASADGDT